MDIRKSKSIDLEFSNEKQFLQSSSTNGTKPKRGSTPADIALQVWEIILGKLAF
jgi:hypothetical protein